jgi:hypothetical protein
MLFKVKVEARVEVSEGSVNSVGGWFRVLANGKAREGEARPRPSQAK